MATAIVSNSNGAAMLFYYARIGHLGMLTHYIVKGVGVNTIDGEGFTALHLAVKALENSFDMTSLLLANGADVNARSKKGITPLHCAAAHGSFKVVKLLLVNGANPKARTNDGKTPTDWTQSTQIANLLVSYGGAPKTIKDEEKVPKTKLMAFVAFGKSLSGWLSRKRLVKKKT